MKCRWNAPLDVPFMRLGIPRVLLQIAFLGDASEFGKIHLIISLGLF